VLSSEWAGECSTPEQPGRVNESAERSFKRRGAKSQGGKEKRYVSRTWPQAAGMEETLVGVSGHPAYMTGIRMKEKGAEGEEKELLPFRGRGNRPGLAAGRQKNETVN